MSELAPTRGPFVRPLPAEAAGEPINAVVREAIAEAVEGCRPQAAGAGGLAACVVDAVHRALGDGVVDTGIEAAAKALPDRYVARQRRSETALKFLDRADFRSYFHPALISPVITLVTRSGERCHVGTDKLGHLMQQGHDSWLIAKAVDERFPGLGQLFAEAWGLWSEGREIAAEEIARYLAARRMTADAKYVEEIRGEIRRFLTTSETAELLSPNPAIVRDSAFLRKLAHALGTHRKGILGVDSTGIFSAADVAANEDGFRFYLDLARDPQELAESFDIADYASCAWDEEVNPPEYDPVVEQRMQDAEEGVRRSWFVSGIAVRYAAPANDLALSMPFFLWTDDDLEVRLRLGGSLPLSGERRDYALQSRILAGVDVLARMEGMHYLFIALEGGFTPRIAHEKERALCATIGAGYEVMFMGWGSLSLGVQADPITGDFSGTIGTTWVTR